MSTGIMYKLTMDSLKTVRVIAHNVNSNQDSTVGIFTEPNLTGLLFDAIGFDANNGIIYHIGIHTDFSTHLYAMRCRDSIFTFTKTPITTSFHRTIFSGVNYDNVHNKIYARMAKLDSSNTYLGSDIVEINASNGTLTTKIAINQFPFFAAASSCFDQRTSTYIVIGAMNGLNRKMICYNTVTDSLAIGYVPNGVADLQCDNTAFAQLKYGTPTSINKIIRAEPIGVYPNPFSDKLTISIPTSLMQNDLKFELINILGELVFVGNILNTQTELSIPGLTKGIYFYKVVSQNKLIQTRKIVVE
ncbi:MAG: T9SS type A sorting domain-containing protein [Bacteroidia bacterium]|nr:T9SS type A sorting domain-containing protein [Bacteroidia bacterium]